MRIIREAEIERACRYCGTLVGLGTGDIQHDDVGSLPYEYYFVCPNCHIHNDIDFNSLPLYFQKAVE